MTGPEDRKEGYEKKKMNQWQVLSCSGSKVLQREPDCLKL